MVGFLRSPMVRETAGLTHPPLDILRCKLRAKSRMLGLASQSSYSNRKMSTGNSLAAALAGTKVAPMEIAMATIEIQTPSNKLG
jgi:hypothetical protein